MIFAELDYEEDYGEMHFDLVDYLQDRFPIFNMGFKVTPGYGYLKEMNQSLSRMKIFGHPRSARFARFKRMHPDLRVQRSIIRRVFAV